MELTERSLHPVQLTVETCFAARQEHAGKPGIETTRSVLSLCARARGSLRLWTLSNALFEPVLSPCAGNFLEGVDRSIVGWIVLPHVASSA